MAMDEARFCIFLGAGGHARVLIEALRASGFSGRGVLLDPDRSLWGKERFGLPVLGGDERIGKLAEGGEATFVVAVGSVGATDLRRRLYALGRSFALEPMRIVHPSAIVSPSAHLGAGVQLLAGSIVNAAAVIGENVIVNTGAIVEHDCRIGDHVHIATGARLASTVEVGAGAHVGAGATIRQEIRIGPGAIVGAGAVVVKDVPAETTVVGVPAHPLPRETR